MNQEQKLRVFCIGYQKTGTSSLGLALQHLGYKVCGYNEFRDLAATSVENIEQVIRQRAQQLMMTHNAFKDTPWPMLYEQMDKLDPDARFILVTRDTEKWIQSAVKDFGTWPNAIHEWNYGVPFPAGNEAIWQEKYETHNLDVQRYFAGRASFLHLQLDKGEVNWANICRFLGEPVPSISWPHANTLADKSRRKLLARIRYHLTRFLPNFTRTSR